MDRDAIDPAVVVDHQLVGADILGATRSWAHGTRRRGNRFRRLGSPPKIAFGGAYFVILPIDLMENGASKAERSGIAPKYSV
jgi:hypothetical protein